MRVSLIYSHHTSTKWTVEWRTNWAFPSAKVFREITRRGTKDPSQALSERVFVRFGPILVNQETYRHER